MTELPHGEAWLLELLAMDRVPVWCLMRGKAEMEAWLNRGFHNLSRQAVRDTLRRLFDHGDIEAFSEDSDNGFVPSDLQLQGAYQKRHKELYCGATKQGSERWESLACPNWSRYYEFRSWGENSCEVIAGSHERLIELMQGSELLWDIVIDVDSVSVERLCPWEAKPWKTLPNGFRALVPSKEIDSPSWRSSNENGQDDFKQWWAEYIRLRSWATSICGNEQL